MNETTRMQFIKSRVFRKNNDLKKYSLSGNLRKLMKNYDLDAPELSRKSGIPVQTINRLRRDEESNPTLASLIPLAAYFHLTLNELIGLDEMPSDATFGKMITQKLQANFVPLIKMQNLKTNFETNIPYVVTSNDSFIATSIKVSKDAFALTISSDVLVPLFREGTILIFDPNVNTNNKDVVLALLNNSRSPKIRQIFIDNDDHYFKPINPEFGKMVQCEEYKLLGVMVQAQTNYRD
ncbi:MAG: S24 family peptidase [Pseudomonadota bacterium]